MNKLMKRVIALGASVLVGASFAGCSDSGGFNTDVKPASEYTQKHNNSVYEILDFDDKTEAKLALEGLIDAPKTLELKNADGEVVWSQKAFGFLEESSKAPGSVNPSLWANSVNNHAYGLFKVTEGIYQVRGYDMANLTVVDGNEGRIIIDPLMSVECCKGTPILCGARRRSCCKRRYREKYDSRNDF